MAYLAKTKELTLKTTHRQQFITITPEVEQFISESGIKDGSVMVQTHHTTCRVWVNEDEKNLIGNKELDANDLKRVLDRFASPEEDYGHDDIRDVNNPQGKRDTHLCPADANGVVNECRNGHSHAQALILPHAVTMIVSNGKLVKGQWQEIMLAELDHDRERKITLLVQGSD